jgi:hypothetical protein
MIASSGVAIRTGRHPSFLVLVPTPALHASALDASQFEQMRVLSRDVW